MKNVYMYNNVQVVDMQYTFSGNYVLFYFVRVDPLQCMNAQFAFSIIYLYYIGYILLEQLYLF